MQPAEQLAVEIIYHLLCLCRRRVPLNGRGAREAIQNRRLLTSENSQQEGFPFLPRLPFVARLCQAASLLDDSSRPYPTLLVEEWMSWPVDQQITHLLTAWMNIPGKKKVQYNRAGLLDNLAEGKNISAFQRLELAGPQFLGICHGEQITPLGQQILHPVRSQAAGMLGAPNTRWALTGRKLFVTDPANWALLWALEEFIDPIGHGQYELSETTLRLAAQRGALQCVPSLPEVIEQGTGQPMPAELHQSLIEAATIRIVKGVVLEFSHLEELKALRKLPGLRKQLDHMLSPRHIALDPSSATPTMRRLQQRGLLSERDLSGQLATDICGQKTIPLSTADRAFLLSLTLVIEKIQTTETAPPGLVSRLCAGFSPSLRAAAAKRASRVIRQIQPPAVIPSSIMPTALSTASLAQYLQTMIDREESIDVSYQSTAQHSPEIRHLTPILIERRGGHIYLIAYCHTRRANRTFRLDRMKLCLDSL